METGPNKGAELLKALVASSSARTKTGRIKELLPYLEAALAAGVKQQAIVEELKKIGLEMSVPSFSKTLRRVREKAVPVASAPSSQKTVHQSSAATPPVLAPKKEGEESPAVEGQASDTPLTLQEQRARRESLGQKFIEPKNSNPLVKQLNLKEKK